MNVRLSDKPRWKVRYDEPNELRVMNCPKCQRQTG